MPVKETSETPNLTTLLNKVEALIKCGAGEGAELARFLKKPNPRVSEWVMSRKFAPTGEIALLMQAFAAMKTLEVDAAGEGARKAYRTAYKEVCERHPVK